MENSEEREDMNCPKSHHGLRESFLVQDFDSEFRAPYPFMPSHEKATLWSKTVIPDYEKYQEPEKPGKHLSEKLTGLEMMGLEK